MRKGGVSPSRAKRGSSENIRTIFCIKKKQRIDTHTRLSLRFTARSTCGLCMGYFVCARCWISRELSIESCKLASYRHRLQVYILESRRSVRFPLDFSADFYLCTVSTCMQLPFSLPGDRCQVNIDIPKYRHPG